MPRVPPPGSPSLPRVPRDDAGRRTAEPAEAGVGSSPPRPPAPRADLPPAAARELDEVRRDAAVAARALPGEMQAALARALTTSADRVASAFAVGRIDGAEAARSARMLDEMVDALVAIEEGRFEVLGDDGYPHSDLVAREVKTTDGDVLRVGVRPLASDGGQARVKLENISDGGTPMSRPDRVMVRFDLEVDDTPTPASLAVVDLQFGHERRRDLDGARPLDLRIHGVLLEDGVPKLHRGGGVIADHHFRAGVPETLDDEAAFAAFAREFLDELERDDALAGSP